MTARIGLYRSVIGASILILVGLLVLAGSGTAGLPPRGLLVGLGGFCAIAALWALVGLSRATAAATEARAAAEAEMGRLSRLVGAVPDAWCGWTADGLLTVSPQCPGLLGLSRIEGLEDVETALAPGDAAALHGSFARLTETGDGFRLRVRTASEDRTLEIRGSAGSDTDGGHRLAVLWLRDVTADGATTERLETARREADAALASLRAVLDLLPVPVWTRDAGSLDLLWCNKSYASAVDTSPAVVLERQIELPSAKFGERPRDLAERVQASGAAETETRHAVIGGERRLLAITEVPVPARDRILGYALDTTREAELGSELDRHVAAHAEILEKMGSAIAIYGPDTRLRFYNQAYVRLWSFDEAWLEAEPTFGEVLEDLRTRRKLAEPADFPRWKRQRLAMFTSLIEPEEDLMHLPDGRTLRALHVPHPMGGIMFVLEDVTNALALESSYNTLMAVQQETLDNLTEGIAVFGGDGRLKLWNPAYARVWKLNPDDLAGEPHIVQVVDRMRPLLLKDGSGWDAYRAELIAATLDRTSRSGRIERLDGTVVAYANVPLPDGAVLLTVFDVTDSVRVEQALRASNEALEHADRLKSEFLANVSYQLRTPLNAIMGFAEILTNEYFGGLNDRQMDYARGVLEASQRLLALVNDILDLATIEAGFMTLDLESVDVCTLVGAVADLSRDWVAKRNLRIDVRCPPDLGVIEADERRLKQALFNLVSNAVKFTPAGGRILIEADRDPKDGMVVLAVSDTGVGIPAAERERVFDRFERADPRMRHSGAGLGLALVKSFVELHGGSVEIDSRPDQGTRVICRLPAADPDAPRPRSKAGRDRVEVG